MTCMKRAQKTFLAFCEVSLLYTAYHRRDKENEFQIDQTLQASNTKSVDENSKALLLYKFKKKSSHIAAVSVNLSKDLNKILAPRLYVLLLIFCDERLEISKVCKSRSTANHCKGIFWHMLGDKFNISWFTRVNVEVDVNPDGFSFWIVCWCHRRLVFKSERFGILLNSSAARRSLDQEKACCCCTIPPHGRRSRTSGISCSWPCFESRRKF